MEGKTLETYDVLFGRYNFRETEALLGDPHKAENYLRELDGYALLSAVHIPSIHFYPRNAWDNSLAYGGDKVEKYFAHSGQPHLFIKGSPTFSLRDMFAAWDENNRAENKRFYEQLADFLAQNLAVSK